MGLPTRGQFRKGWSCQTANIFGGIMNTDLLAKFEPMLSVALERFQRFQNPEPRDITKIFGPVLETICNVAGVDKARAASIIGSWDVSTITADTLRSAVAEITKPTMAAMTAARAKQLALELELARDAAAHPLTARALFSWSERSPCASGHAIPLPLNFLNSARSASGLRKPMRMEIGWGAFARRCNRLHGFSRRRSPQAGPGE